VEAAKNIKTIAPLLADDFLEVVEPVFDLAEYNKFLELKKSKLGVFGKYLIGKLHDSKVLKIEFSGNEITINLDDFATHVFADAVIQNKKLKINHKDIPAFPIWLNFRGDLKVAYYLVDEEGNLQQISPVKLDEYLYEQVLDANEDQIEMAFCFWQSNGGKPDNRTVVRISAKEFYIIEKQEEAWRQIFGNTYDGHYEYFKQQFNSERYVSDFHNCLALVDEFDNQIAI
jgi:hypothetical protein